MLIELRMPLVESLFIFHVWKNCVESVEKLCGECGNFFSNITYCMEKRWHD
jgi:hypothetical protein